MVLSPEHALVETITTPEQKAAVEEYQKQASFKSDLERTELAKTKTGVFTGAYALNPVNGKISPSGSLTTSSSATEPGPSWRCLGMMMGF